MPLFFLQFLARMVVFLPFAVSFCAMVLARPISYGLFYSLADEGVSLVTTEDVDLAVSEEF